jgi:hypothetical protein
MHLARLNRARAHTHSVTTSKDMIRGWYRYYIIYICMYKYIQQCIYCICSNLYI